MQFFVAVNRTGYWSIYFILMPLSPEIRIVRINSGPTTSTHGSLRHPVSMWSNSKYKWREYFLFYNSLILFRPQTEMFLKWLKTFKSFRSECLKIKANEHRYGEFWYNCETNDRNVSVTKNQARSKPRMWAERGGWQRLRAQSRTFHVFWVEIREKNLRCVELMLWPLSHQISSQPCNHSNQITSKTGLATYTLLFDLGPGVGHRSTEFRFDFPHFHLRSFQLDFTFTQLQMKKQQQMNDAPERLGRCDRVQHLCWNKLPSSSTAISDQLAAM